MEKYAIVAVVRTMTAIWWNRRVPRSLCIFKPAMLVTTHSTLWNESTNRESPRDHYKIAEEHDGKDCPEPI